MKIPKSVLGHLTASQYSSSKALIMKLIRMKARRTGDPGSSISNSRPAGKFALWAPKPPPRLLPPPSLPPGKEVRAEARKEIKYILSAGPFVQVTLGFQASQLNEWSMKCPFPNVFESHHTRTMYIQQFTHTAQPHMDSRQVHLEKEEYEEFWNCGNFHNNYW